MSNLKGGPKHPEIEVQLVGEDSNAFAIMGRVVDALKDAGYGDEVDEYREKSMSGDYDHLLRTAMEYVNVS